MSNETTIWEQLREPFPVDFIELKPGATNKEKTSALAMPYADVRAYQIRLDAVVGVGGWAVHYERWTDERVICSLTINGVTKSDVGESDQKDIGGTAAVAQAFKRACSCFGLGRFLYALPSTWLDYDSQKKRFTGDVDGAIRWMYQQVGIEVGETQAASVVPREIAPVRSDIATKKRDQRAQGIASMGLVTRNGEAFKVASATSGGQKQYFDVWRDQAGKVQCSCGEFAAQANAEPPFRCEHILAVKHALVQKSAEGVAATA